MEAQADHGIHCGADNTKADVYSTQDEGECVKCPACGRSDTLAFARAEAAKADLAGRIDRAIKDSAVEDMTGLPSTAAPRWVFRTP